MTMGLSGVKGSTPVSKTGGLGSNPSGSATCTCRNKLNPDWHDCDCPVAREAVQGLTWARMKELWEQLKANSVEKVDGCYIIPEHMVNHDKIAKLVAEGELDVYEEDGYIRFRLL